MPVRRLEEALYRLHVALIEPDILGAGERVTVELPYEAGIRFECWIRKESPEELMRCGAFDWCRLVDVDTDDPKREITLQGVTIRWPQASSGTGHQAGSESRKPPGP